MQTHGHVSEFIVIPESRKSSNPAAHTKLLNLNGRRDRA